jgi:hypothetical protein
MWIQWMAACLVLIVFMSRLVANFFNRPGVSGKAARPPREADRLTPGAASLPGRRTR